MRNNPTAKIVSRGTQTDDPVKMVPIAVQTDPPLFPLVSVGVQTSPVATPDLIDLAHEPWFFEVMKIDPDDVELVRIGTPYQPPPRPFPPVAGERFKIMSFDEESIDEDEDAGRKKRRVQHETDDFTHTRASTSAGLTRPFGSEGSNDPQTSASSSPHVNVVSTAVQTDSYPPPPPGFTTIGTQTDPAPHNRSPIFDLRVSGVMNVAFPELNMYSLLPTASLIVPNDIVSYESFPGATDNMYLVHLVPRFSHVWLPSEFIHSSYPELAQAFLRSNPNYTSSGSSDNNENNADVDIETGKGFGVGVNGDDDTCDSDSIDEILDIES